MAEVYMAGDVRNGTTFEMDGSVFKVVEFQHVKPVKVEQYTEPNIIKKQEIKIADIAKEKEDAIKMQNFEKAAKLRDTEKKEKEKREKRT